MLNFAVIGLGRWGPNHVRIFDSMPGCNVTAVADTSQQARERIQTNFKDVLTTADYREVLRRQEVNAVVVATPTSTHYEIVRAALDAGKHVLCEKPLTTRGSEAWELVRHAEAKGLHLVTGHVFLHNAAVAYLVSAVKDGVTGPLFYATAVRTNLGPFRSDVNAAWDLASHDIYIFNAILGARPTGVSAVGGSYLRKPVEDIAFLTLYYPAGVLGHIHVSWLDPKKVRTLTIVGEKKMITWDEFGMPGTVMIYDRSVVRDTQYNTFGEFQLLTREGDVVVPRIPMQEPLAAQAKAFAALCAGSVKTVSGAGREGAEVVDVLDATTRSLQQAGKLVDIAYGG